MVYKQSIHKKTRSKWYVRPSNHPAKKRNSSVALGLLRQCAASQCIASMLKVIICDAQISHLHELRQKHNTVSQGMNRASSENNICLMCVLRLPIVMRYETQIKKNKK